MPSSREVIEAQFKARTHPVPDEILNMQFVTLERGLRIARFQRNQADEMKWMAPGPALSLIREVQMLRAFRDEVTTYVDGLEKAEEKEKPVMAGLVAAKLIDAVGALAGLYHRFGEDLVKMDEEEVKKADAGEGKVILLP
jgi:hypothetical protein